MKTVKIFFVLTLFFSTALLGQSPADSICISKTEALLSLDVFNQPDQSIAVIEKLLPEYFAAQCWDSYADCFNLLSAAYYYKRNYQQAKENAQKAVTTSEKYSGKELMYAAAIANLSVFVDVKQSIALQKESLQIEKKFGSDYEALSWALEGLGLSYQQIGDYDTAIEYFKQAIENIKINETENSHEEARLLRQIASCYKSKDNFKAVFLNLKKTIAILDKLPSVKYYQQTRWYAYNDLAEVYLKTGDTKTAKTYIEKAIQMHEGNELLEQYKSWMTYGAIYLKEGNEEQALYGYTQAQQDAEQEFDSYQYHVALSKPYAGIANVYAKKKEYKKSLTAYAKALQFLAIDFQTTHFIQNPKSDSFIHDLEALQVLDGKASVLSAHYESTQDLDLLKAAHDTRLLAAQLIHAVRLNYLAEGSKHTLVEKTHTLYMRAIDVALSLYRITQKEDYLSDAFMFAESNKAVLLYESIKNKTAKSQIGISDSLLTKEKDLLAELAFYETQILEEKQKKVSKDQDLIRQWDKRVFQLRNDIQATEEKMEKKYPKYQTLKKQTEPIRLKDLQKSLSDSKTGIIEFVLGEDLGYVFFISKHTQNVFAIPGENNLKQELSEINQLIAAPSESSEQFKTDFYTFRELSSSLHRQLLSQGLMDLPEEIEHLIFIPDGILNYLPFDLLIRNSNLKKETNLFYKDLNYLFQEYQISYNYSASMTALNSTADLLENREKLFLGFAPSFDEQNIAAIRTCKEGALSGLFCNKKEVLGIHEVLQGKVYTDQQATLSTFEKEVPNYQILHLATHACIHEEEIALNKIFFSNQEYLAQSQLTNMDLSTKLTVLSACDTGSGKLQQGEGVMSLARCFLMAGSQSVLTSLWSVDDCSTSAMMHQYYKNINQGFYKDKAIAQAKQTYLEGADLSNSHPYYWAAFVQFGNVDPLLVRELNAWYFLLGGIAFLFVGFFYTKFFN